MSIKRVYYLEYCGDNSRELTNQKQTASRARYARRHIKKEIGLMKNIKALFAVAALLAALTLSLTSCGGDNNTANGGNGTGSAGIMDPIESAISSAGSAMSAAESAMHPSESGSSGTSVDTAAVSAR